MNYIEVTIKDITEQIEIYKGIKYILIKILDIKDN